MIQDIAPHIFDNQYAKKEITNEDYVFIFQKGAILVEKGKEGIEFPQYSDLIKTIPNIKEKCIYFFSIDAVNYFYIQNFELEETTKWRYESIHNLRTQEPMWKVFAASVGVQLYQWYQSHKYCGCCASKMNFHKEERAMQCPACNNTVYPTLSPSVIVAVTNQDKLLLTKYAYGIYKNYALVAGYAEIGEGLEETVRREVLEEVGLKVKNITYYKTQPWPFSGSLLIGYFAEVDGDDTVTLQESELSEGTWFLREDLPPTDNHISLTSEMIEVFRKNEIGRK